MARYAIGDLQGCYIQFQALLDKLAYSPSRDELWLAGDLVNRGPDSLSCLRLARDLEARIVLGNHDLHLLACYYSEHLLKRKDTLRDIFEANDCDDLMEWLRKQPLVQVDDDNKLFMSHAGLPHIWKVKKARKYAQEVHEILAGNDKKALSSYFSEMYGNDPDVWEKSLTGQARLRVITNYLTRMRFVDQNGRLDFSVKEGVDKTPHDFKPWFAYPVTRKWVTIFGHWAALEGHTGNRQFQAIDTGCVWGGSLTALNIDTFERVSVEA